MIVEYAVEDYQDGHVDIEEHHGGLGAELSVMQHVQTGGKDRQSATAVE